MWNSSSSLIIVWSYKFEGSSCINCCTRAYLRIDYCLLLSKLSSSSFISSSVVSITHQKWLDVTLDTTYGHYQKVTWAYFFFYPGAFVHKWAERDVPNYIWTIDGTCNKVILSVEIPPVGIPIVVGSLTRLLVTPLRQWKNSAKRAVSKSSWL